MNKKTKQTFQDRNPLKQFIKCKKTGLQELNKLIYDENIQYPNIKHIYRFQTQYKKYDQIYNPKPKFCQYLYYRDKKTNSQHQSQHNKEYSKYQLNSKKNPNYEYKQKLLDISCYQDMLQNKNNESFLRILILQLKIKLNDRKKLKPYLKDSYALNHWERFQTDYENLEESKIITDSWAQIKQGLMSTKLGADWEASIIKGKQNEQDNQQFSQVNEEYDQDEMMSMFPFFKDELIYSDEFRNIQFNWNQLEMIMQILEELIIYPENPIQKKNSNLYILSAPTGTGKTLCFIIASLMWFQIGLPQTTFINKEDSKDNSKKSLIDNNQRKAYINTVNTIVFANSSVVSNQIFREFLKYTNLMVSYMDVVFDPIKNKFELLILTKCGNDVINMLEIDSIQYEPIYSKVIIAGVKHQICHYLLNKTENTHIDMRYLRNSGFFGQIFITSLHFYPFMEQYGIIDCVQNIQNVIYDEIDVYYNFQSLDEFHRFFSKKTLNFTANNIIFSSATINPNLVDITDINLSGNYMFMNDQKIFTEIMDKQTYTMITPTTLYANCNFANAEQLFQNYQQQGTTYLYFNLHRGMLSYVSTNTQKGYQIHHMDRIEKPKFTTTQDLFNWLLQRYNIIFITNKKLRYLPFLRLNPQRCVKYKYIVNSFTEYQPSITLTTEIVICNDFKRSKYNEFIGQQHTLIITYDEPYIMDMLTQLESSYESQSNEDDGQVYRLVQGNQDVRSGLDKHVTDHNYKNKFVNIKTPFFNQLRNTVSTDFIISEPEIIENKSKYIDLITGSRGLDIPNLEHVFILLPAFMSFTDANFTQTVFKQAIGRVGRNGNHGYAHIIFYGGFPDLDLNEGPIPFNFEKYQQFLELCAKTPIDETNMMQIYLDKLSPTYDKNVDQMKSWIKQLDIDYQKEDDDSRMKQLNAKLVYKY